MNLSTYFCLAVLSCIDILELLYPAPLVSCQNMMFVSIAKSSICIHACTLLSCFAFYWRHGCLSASLSIFCTSVVFSRTISGNFPSFGFLYKPLKPSPFLISSKPIHGNPITLLFVNYGTTLQLKILRPSVFFGYVFEIEIPQRKTDLEFTCSYLEHCFKLLRIICI